MADIITNPTEALQQNTRSLYTNYAANSTIPINLNVKNDALQKAVEQTQEAAKLSITANLASLFEAQMGVENLQATRYQYKANKSLINRNIEVTQSVMMNNLEDSMAQLDSVSAAKNVDINSQALRFTKEKALMDMGKDFATMQVQGDLQKAALDLQFSMQKAEVKNARNKVLTKSIENIIEASKYLL